jgi:hypothetical protein
VSRKTKQRGEHKKLQKNDRKEKWERKKKEE